MFTREQTPPYKGQHIQTSGCNVFATAVDETCSVSLHLPSTSDRANPSGMSSCREG